MAPHSGFAVCCLCFVLALVVPASTQVPIKFCRTQTTATSLGLSDVAQQEGYTFWKEWVTSRGGVSINNEKVPIQFLAYEDGGDAAVQRILYQRFTSKDNCDFLFGPFATSSTGKLIMRTFESGIGFDADTTVSPRPYLYRHGTSYNSLWKNQNWTWSFSLQPSGNSQPLPCLSRYVTAGATRAVVVYHADEFGLNDAVVLPVIAAAQAVGLNVTKIIKLNLTEEAFTDEFMQNVSREVVPEQPDILLLKLGTHSHEGARAFLESVRATYTGLKGVHFMGSNVFTDVTAFQAAVGWAGNQSTCATQWAPNTYYTDQYFNSTQELYEALQKRFPNSTIGDQHISAVMAGLIYVIAIEQTNSIDPTTIRNYLANSFNRTLSVGHVAWLPAGELVGTSWNCIQLTGDHVTVLTDANANATLVYPAIAIRPPKPKNKRFTDTGKSVLIGVLAGLGGLLVIGLLVALVVQKRYHLIFIKKEQSTAEWE